MKLLPRSFRRRLALFIALFSILGAAPVYGYLEWFYAEQQIQERRTALQNLANAVGTLVSANLRERQREVERLARNPLLRKSPAQSNEVTEALERLQDSYPHYSWIGFTNTTGSVLSSTKDLLKGQSVALRPWFIEGLHGSYIGDLHEAVLLAKLLPQLADTGPIRFIDFAAPVYDTSNQLLGVLAAHAHWRWADAVIGAILPMLSEEDHIDIMLINRQGEVMYPERPDTPKKLPVTSGDTHEHFLTWDDGRTYLTAFSPVPEVVSRHPLNWQVVVRQPQAIALSSLTELRHTLLITGLLLITLLLAASGILARQISRPVEKLASLARRIEQGEENPSFNIATKSTELTELVSAIRGMASTLLNRKHALEANNQQLEATVQARTAALSQANAELLQLARHDTLTCLPNRRALDDRLKSDFARWLRLATPYAVLVIDIDHFKQVNDTYGHAAGDAVLQRLADLLREHFRESDLCGRQGGEEFLVILTLEAERNAWQAAERFRLAVANTEFPHVGRLTISIGLAWPQPDDQHAEQIVQRADAELYKAKESGRNQVCPLDSEPSISDRPST